MARSEVEEIMLTPMDSLPDSLSSEVTVVVELSKESATDCSTKQRSVTCNVLPPQCNTSTKHINVTPARATTPM